MDKNIDNSNLLKTIPNANITVSSDTTTIKDKLHDYIKNNFADNQKLFTILNEILFYGAFVYYYYFGPLHDSNQTFIILKYILIIFVLRYLFNYITSYTTQNDQNQQVTYFKLNSKIAIVSILILFLSNNTQNIDNNITSLLLIIGYAILSSCAQYGYTDDNIITILVIYCLFKSKIVN